MGIVSGFHCSRIRRLAGKVQREMAGPLYTWPEDSGSADLITNVLIRFIIQQIWWQTATGAASADTLWLIRSLWAYWIWRLRVYCLINPLCVFISSPSISRCISCLYVCARVGILILWHTLPWSLRGSRPCGPTCCTTRPERRSWSSSRRSHQVTHTHTHTHTHTRCLSCIV